MGNVLRTWESVVLVLGRYSEPEANRAWHGIILNMMLSGRMKDQDIYQCKTIHGMRLFFFKAFKPSAHLPGPYHHFGNTRHWAL